MFAALALKDRGIDAQIIDTGLWACSHSYALALHPRSLEVLKQLGLAEQIWNVAYPVRRIGLYDASGQKASVQMDDAPIAVMRQSALEDLLEGSLSGLNVRVLWRHELTTAASTDGRASARINKLEKDTRGYAVAHSEWAIAKTLDFDVAFVLGADGHDSQVRRAVGIDFPEIGPAQYYAVFEFKSDVDLANEMRIVLGERTTDVLWPLPDGHCRWSFELPDYADTEAEQLKDRLLAGGFGHFPTKRLKDRVPAAVEWGNTPALDEQHLRALLAERAPWFEASVGRLNWRTIVRFERRLASAFGSGRIWLAGDAAHVTLPAGVQSMNLGLVEASELVEIFTRILAGQGSEAELQDYNARWSSTWRLLHGLERGLCPKPRTDPWIRARAERLMRCLPAHGAALAQLADQLDLEVAGSAQTAS